MTYDYAERSRNLAFGRLAIVALWTGITGIAAFRFFGSLRWEPVFSGPGPRETSRIAYSLYAHGQFANPFAYVDSGLTAHLAPAYPFLLSVLYRLFGDGAAGHIAAGTVESVVLMAQLALLPSVTTALGCESGAKLWAALFAAAGLRRFPLWESNYVGLLLIVATLLTCRFADALSDRTERHPKDSLAVVGAMGGVVWGIILLTSPMAAPVWVGLLVAAAWYGRRVGKPYSWLPILIVPLLVIAPWTLRNYAVFHKVIPVRVNLGLELHVSHNPCAHAAASDSARSGCRPHPNAGPGPEAELLSQVGETEYNAIKLRQALAWIRTHPGAATQLTRQRIGLFWFPGRNSLITEPAGGRLARLSAWVADIGVLLTVPGLILLYRTDRRGALLCLVLLIGFSTGYYLFQFSERYREPVMWVIFVLAGVSCQKLVSLLSSGQRTHPRN